ncbi:Glycoprotein gp2 [Pseudonocardia sp. Ae717_Ps2]|uniref:alpha/beta hydrolase family protein n=1 Tax=Pseudonocardia sp. Ae717_Ps2 TaxID=1885573 RepID=UPI00095F89B8|nr:acetylxylan esterase [Pseudonocardia sp. Ae717_Ps2]OLM28551.1 Glycoprotein gp2 [Pseudonocardia sp. Ae717_Ps2]OLM28692.1 Glycoprotein gp2 [Pseudonocardia sp. Ae717_Ps2]
MVIRQQQPAAGRGRRRSAVGRACSAALLATAVLCTPSIHPAAVPPAAIERTAGWTVPAAPSQDDDDSTSESTQTPNPLVLDSGGQVEDVQSWEQQRRPELLEAFQEHVYGQSLPTPEEVTFDDGGASGESAKTVTISVTGPAGTASFTLRLFVPETGTPTGTFLLIDHRGSVGDDADSSSGYAPTAKILDAGYAFAALNAEEVAPDDAGSYRDGVINAFYPAGQDLPSDAGRTISAWAWGASRAMDYLETDPDIDPSKVAVIGHSRGGKAALWAGAQDTRFPVVISNNSGSTGAKLARRDDSGESIAAITEQFPHWFPDTYSRYAGNAGSLPVDQNQLLALIAPGRVVVGSATDDGNADPQGEFLSYLGAAPAYELYGLGDTGLTSDSWPPTENEAFRGPGMSYHLRAGSHGLEETDWDMYLAGELFER